MHAITIITSFLLLAPAFPTLAAPDTAGAHAAVALSARESSPKPAGLGERKTCKCIKVKNEGLHRDYCHISSKFVVTDG